MFNVIFNVIVIDSSSYTINLHSHTQSLIIFYNINYIYAEISLLSSVVFP